jgi:hypothetical protein
MSAVDSNAKCQSLVTDTAVIEKALLKQRLANLHTAKKAYIEKQKKALA